MSQKGGLNGVHQVHSWWERDPDRAIEDDEFVASLSEKLTANQVELQKRSDLLRAFHANCPDVSGIRSREAKEKAINDFLGGRRWKSIVKRILG